MHPFWKGVLSSWCLIHFTIEPSALAVTTAFLNSFFLKSQRSCKKPLEWKTIKLIDVCKTKDRKVNRICLTKQCKRDLLSASLDESLVEMTNTFLNGSMKTRNIYRIAVLKLKPRIFKVASNWEAILKVTGVEQKWSSVVKQVRVIPNIKLRTFAIRFFNMAYVTNTRLSHFGRNITDSCTFCKQERETFLHRYWDCQIVNKLWKQIIAICKIFFSEEENYSCENILLWGFKTPGLNMVMVVTKYYIHIARAFLGTINIDTWFSKLSQRVHADFQSHAKLPYLRQGQYKRNGGVSPHVDLPWWKRSWKLLKNHNIVMTS